MELCQILIANNLASPAEIIHSNQWAIKYLDSQQKHTLTYRKSWRHSLIGTDSKRAYTKRKKTKDPSQFFTDLDVLYLTTNAK